MIGKTKKVHLSRGAGGFLPSNVPGLDLWLDSEEGITKDGSDNVSQWDDRMGSAIHSFVQATGANQPDWNANQINGHPTIDFNGTSDFLKEVIANYLIGSNTWTIFIVCISAGTNTNENAITTADEGITNKWFVPYRKGRNAQNNSITIGINDSGNIDTVYGDTGLNDSNPHILVVESTGTSYGLRIDGTNETVNEAAAGDNSGKGFDEVSGRDNLVIGALLYGGATVYYSSRFAEFIVYNTQVSSSNRGLIENYLATKYNISI